MTKYIEKYKEENIEVHGEGEHRKLTCFSFTDLHFIAESLMATYLLLSFMFL